MKDPDVKFPKVTAPVGCYGRSTGWYPAAIGGTLTAASGRDAEMRFEVDTGDRLNTTRVIAAELWWMARIVGLVFTSTVLPFLLLIAAAGASWWILSGWLVKRLTPDDTEYYTGGVLDDRPRKVPGC